MAASLHFLYPPLVNLICRLIYQEKLGQIKRAAITVGTMGVPLFPDFRSSGSPVGIVLALLSSGAYAFYILYTAISGLKRMYYFRLAFYLGLGVAVVSGAFGLATGRLHLHLTPTAVATALFQQGIRLAGFSNAALLTTFEPVIGVAPEALLLGESISTAKWAGCVHFVQCTADHSGCDRASPTWGAPPLKWSIFGENLPGGAGKL